MASLAGIYHSAEKIFSLDGEPPFKPGEVTLTSGYFDGLHWAQIAFLEECRRLGNPLAVGVRANAISSKPGDRIYTDEERVRAIAGLTCVDYPFIDTQGYGNDLINLLQPKTVVFSTGEAFSAEKQAEIDALTAAFPHLIIRYIARQSNTISSSDIKKRILRLSQAKPEKQLPREQIAHEDIYPALLQLAGTSLASFKTAAMLMQDNEVVAKGVNYHPHTRRKVNFINTDTLEYREQKPRPTHAEVAVILASLNSGVDREQTTLHSLHLPCAGCAEIISLVGIKKVVYYLDFDNDYGLDILQNNGVEVMRASLPRH